MAIFYQADIRKSNAEEIWWGSKKNPIVFILYFLILKVFRARSGCTSDDPNVDSLADFQVAALPEEIGALFATMTGELEALGFSQPIYHFFQDAASGSRIYWATFLHQSGQHVARIHNRYWDTQANKMRAFFPVFFTEFADGSFVFSSSGKPDIAAPRTIKMNRMHGASTPDLWSKHRELVDAARQRSEVVPVADHAELLQACERLHQLQIQFHLRRGFFYQPTAQSEAAAQERVQRMEDAKTQGSQFPEVLAEIRGIEDKKVSFSKMTIVLVISAALFFFASASRSKWEIVAWLVPVLVFHELGHWIVMKLFGYRNMRMFFLPFFGAAVSGQNRNVPGWQKALVALAGPLPGILLGMILSGVGAFHSVHWVRTLALILVLLNAFNLLPFLPLDGGRFLQATIFCRNRYLDASFLLVGVVALIISSFFGFGRVLPYVAIGLAIALPIALKTGKIAERFRSVSLPPPLPGDFHIPIAAADPIVAAAKEAFPKQGANLIAQHVLNIYETVNAKPPSLGLTAGLMVIYLSGFAMSALAGLLLVGTLRGSLADFVGDAASAPRHRVEMSGIKVWKGPEQKSGGILVAATFPSKSVAAGKFANATNQLPPTAQALLFGESLILDFPQESAEAGQRWLNQLTAPGVATLLSSNEGVSIDLNAIAPNGATGTNLQENLSFYLGMQMVGAIPPWNLDSGSQKGRRQLESRRVLNHVQSEVQKAMVQVIAKQIEDGSQESLRATSGYSNQITAMFAGKDAAYQRLAKEYAGTPYTNLVDWERQLSGMGATNTTLHARARDSAAAELGVDASRYASNSASGGDVTLKSLRLRVFSMTVASPVDFLPEMVNWLNTNHCIYFTYNIDAVDN